MGVDLLLGGQLDKIPGGHYDGTSEQVLRTKLAQANFVTVPASVFFNNYTTEGVANAINPFGPGPQAGAEGAPTGVGASFYLNMASGSGSTQKQAALVLPIRGKVFGVLYRNAAGSITSTQAPTFAVSIDGEIFPITAPIVRFHNLVQGGGSPKVDLWTLALIADDLPDIRHTVKIIWTSDSAANTRQIVTGFVVDGRYYAPPPRSLTLLDPVAVPVSPSAAVAIPLTPAVPAVGVTALVTATVDRNLKFVRCLYFTNVGGLASSVTLAKAGTAIDSIPVAAGAGSGGVPAAVWDPGDRVAMDGSYTVQVPASGSANVSIIVEGGW